MKGSSDVEKSLRFDHLAFVQKQLIEEGLSESWTAISPSESQLFIDLDTLEGEDTFIHQWHLIKEHWPTASYKVTPSKGGKKHVIVYMGEDISFEGRVALQAALGSDPKREILHLVSHYKGEINPIVLIEKLEITLA